MLPNLLSKIYKIMIGGLIIINLILAEVNIVIWFRVAQEKPLYIGSDFTVYYTAFTMVKEGVSSGLYTQSIESKYQQEALGGGASFEGGWLPFPIPPFFALLFSPLSLIPRIPAYYLWSLGQLGLLLWLFFLLDRLFIYWKKREKQIMILVLLAFWPLAHTFLLGQLSLFILLCFVQFYISLNNYRPVKAGIWLALLILKPQTILMPGIFTVSKRYWRIVITTAITIVGIIILSSMIMGYEPWIRYVQLLQKMSNSFGEFGVFPSIEYTLRGTFYNILGYTKGNIINIISITASIIGILFVLYMGARKQSPDNIRFQLEFAIMVTLSVILSMHLFDHDSLILILPMALFYDYLCKRNFPTKAYILLILLSPTIFFIAAINQFNFLGVIRPPTAIIVILLVWMIKYLILEYRNQGKQEVLIPTTINSI